MCDCAKAAIGRGYIIRGGTYDETKHEFVDTSDYCMPLVTRGEKGRFQHIQISINCCPICGERLEGK